MAVYLLTAAGLEAQTPPDKAGPDQPPAERTVRVSLYFADSTRQVLQAEPRQVTRTDDPVALGRTIIRELAGGPRERQRVRTVPGGDILRAFFIDADKTAYVDLNQTMWGRHPGGVRADILAIYAIVNSLVLNMAEIDAVKFLNAGQNATGGAGHLDLRYPLKADILLIR